MKAFALDEGTLNQLQYTNGDLSPGGFDELLLCVGSASFSESTTYSSVSAPLFGGHPLFVVLAPGAFSYAGPPGQCTCTLSDQTFTTTSNPDTVTLDGWIIVDQFGPAGIWAGSISPPWTPSVSVPSSYVLSGITVTLGQCAPPPPPPASIFLLDHFIDVNGTQLSAHVPDIGGPWLVFSTGLTSTPSITIQGNAAVPAYSTPPGADGQTAAVPAAADSITVTVAGTTQSGLFLGAVARMKDALNLWLGELDVSGGNLLIDEFVSGVYNNRASVPLAVTPPESVTITFAVIGDTFTAVGSTSATSASVTYTSADDTFGGGAGLRQGASVGGASPLTFTYAKITRP
jgi:hypothetical protein